eukprot:SAG31_NODE_144_length_22617_cov_21.520117_12_plen_210_part_00
MVYFTAVYNFVLRPEPGRAAARTRGASIDTAVRIAGSYARSTAQVDRGAGSTVGGRSQMDLNHWPRLWIDELTGQELSFLQNELLPLLLSELPGEPEAVQWPAIAPSMIVRFLRGFAREQPRAQKTVSKLVQVRAVTFSFLCQLLEKCGTFIARCDALIEKVSPCIQNLRWRQQVGCAALLISPPKSVSSKHLTFRRLVPGECVLATLE